MVQRMINAIGHRGPDDAGVLADEEGRVALGHRRLSIIDLSPLGHQPMCSGGGRYWIVYNGEVYNYLELRAELEAEGYRFVSGTDTEVVLAAYVRWGAQALHRLRGMFAFAVWDSGIADGRRVAPGHLFLARDRFGIKPMLYTQRDGVLAFASELKSLLASGMVRREVGRQAVWDYLSLGSVPQPRTILAEVRALPAGHWLRVEQGGEPHIESYWDIAERRSGPTQIPESRAEAVTELRRLLDDAARSHMVADVPVGAFLSGGLDSTAVVGLMSQFVSHPIRTYSIGFETEHGHLNELSWARTAAERFGTDHTEVVVTAEMLRDEYPRLIEAIDQPSLDGTNTYFVARATREGVTVSLSGIGGDELFAGYPQFRRFARARRLAPAGLPIRASFHGLDRFVPRRITHELEFVRHDPLARHATVRRLLREREKQEAVAPDLLRGFEPLGLGEVYRPMLARPLADIVAEVSYVELTGYLVNTLLRDADAMSMAHSLEVRPVLLDHPLAEFAFTLPGEWKLRGGATKRIFRDAVTDLVPEEIATRRKMGFEFPLSRWLSSAIGGRAVDALQSPEAHSIFSTAFLEEAVAAVKGGRAVGNRLWAYVTLVDWMRQNRCGVAEA